MTVRRYLLVLDMDLLAVDEEFDLEPLNYFVAQQEREPCAVEVMSLVNNGPAKLPAMELLLGARVGKFPVAPRPDHDISAAAEHRMNLAVRHLRAIGCQADGIISDEDDLVKAVSAETSATTTPAWCWRWAAARVAAGAGMHLDPVHRLLRRLGPRLVVFPLGPDAPHPAL